ncbi:hypothetical protein [Streptomyces sp. NPDC057690]|uniref:hypothetical protein n=1 Tax=Streptomyces sp. NPDC057690 TaxID=3346214 RepID=UPI0036BDCD1B
MTNYVRMRNLTQETFSLTFTPYSSCTPLQKGEEWDVDQFTVPPWDDWADVMWSNDNVGLQDGCYYWWDIDVYSPVGTYLFTAQAQELGDYSGCDKMISSKRTQQPEWNDPWVTEKGQGTNHTVTVDGHNYEIGYFWTDNEPTPSSSLFLFDIYYA